MCEECGRRDECVRQNNNKKTAILTKKSEVFTTCVVNQSSARICVFEGESTMTKDCYFLGAFEIMCIPPAPRGEPRIQVTFGLNGQVTHCK